MELWQIIAISVAAVVVVAIIGWAVYKQSRSRHLRDHFGPEYDRAVTEIGDQNRAESELAQREARIRKLHIRELSMADRHRFLVRWKQCQAQFVDDPVGAVSAADSLVGEIMQARGYAFDKPDQRIADISAAYPHRAGEYREACGMLTKNSAGSASTEGLRRAFVYYRALFDELLGGEHEEFKRAS